MLRPTPMRCWPACAATLQTDGPPPVTDEVTTKAVGDSTADASVASAPPAMPPPRPMLTSQPPLQRINRAARSRPWMNAAVEHAKIHTARAHVEADMLPPPSVVTTQALGEAAAPRAPAAPQACSAANNVAAPPRIPPRIIAISPIRPRLPAAELTSSVPPSSRVPPTPTQVATEAAPAVRAGESKMQASIAAEKAVLDTIGELSAEHRGEGAQRRLEAFHRLHPQQSLSPDLQPRLRKP